MRIVASGNNSAGFAPLELLTCRDIATRMRVALSGVADVDYRGQENGNRKSEGGAATGAGEFVYNCDRMRNDKLPFDKLRPNAQIASFKTNQRANSERRAGL